MMIDEKKILVFMIFLILTPSFKILKIVKSFNKNYYFTKISYYVLLTKIIF